jgi:hypothetical protein
VLLAKVDHVLRAGWQRAYEDYRGEQDGQQLLCEDSQLGLKKPVELLSN